MLTNAMQPSYRCTALVNLVGFLITKTLHVHELNNILGRQPKWLLAFKEVLYPSPTNHFLRQFITEKSIRLLELFFKKVWCDLDYVIFCYLTISLKFMIYVNPISTLQIQWVHHHIQAMLFQTHKVIKIINYASGHIS